MYKKPVGSWLRLAAGVLVATSLAAGVIVWTGLFDVSAQAPKQPAAAGTDAAAATATGSAEAGADRSQWRADPDPRDAACPRPSEQDRQLHRLARSRRAGISGQQRGAARRNLRPAAARQCRPVRRGGDRSATHAAAADRGERHDANGGLLSVGADAGEFRVALRAGGRALAVVRAFGLIRPGSASRAAATCPGSPARPAQGKNAPGPGCAASGEVRRPAETMIGSQLVAARMKKKREFWNAAATVREYNRRQVADQSASPAAARGAASGHATAPPSSVMNSRRCISSPKLRRRYPNASNECFDRG